MINGLEFEILSSCKNAIPTCNTNSSGKWRDQNNELLCLKQNSVKPNLVLYAISLLYFYSVVGCYSFPARKSHLHCVLDAIPANISSSKTKQIFRYHCVKCKFFPGFCLRSNTFTATWAFCTFIETKMNNQVLFSLFRWNYSSYHLHSDSSNGWTDVTKCRQTIRIELFFLSCYSSGWWIFQLNS